ncbi:MAG: GNAT family N-acetyltransferase [Flavobacteriaceae bacterium]
MKNPYAIGKTVYLRPPEEEDLESDWYTWFSDPAITHFLADRYLPNTKEKQNQFFQESIKSSTRIVLMIIDKKNENLIGVCNLSNISWIHQKAEIALVIGNKSYQRGTFAVETLSLLLKIGFKRLNMRNLITSRLSNNESTKALEKIFRFKEVAKFENFIFNDGIYQNLIYSQLSKKKWEERNSSF